MPLGHRTESERMVVRLASLTHCFPRLRSWPSLGGGWAHIPSAMKTAAKKFETAEGDDADAAYRAVARELDLAARKGVIPRQRADRKKSRLAKDLNRKKSAA